MKIFLLVVTILMLLHRIKQTPRMLSKTIYRAKMLEALNKQKVEMEKQSEENVSAMQGAAILIVLLLDIFLVIYYLLVGNRFSSDITMMVLSALQIITVFITLKKNFNGKMFSQDIEDYKFHRLYFLFNVILDYIYYPLTIYMLITK